jgi:predicted secreted protein with PEFG-CTERM motif
MAPVFGQIVEPIVVTTDKTSYSEGEPIIVTGEVSEILFGYAISIMVIAPNGNVVSIDQVMVNSDKTFGTELAAGGALMKAGGDYTIQVLYGTENRTAETSFSFGGSTPGSDDNLIGVSGTDFMVSFEITGGNLISITPDVDANSLIIAINAFDDGQLTITLPRELIDALMEDGDDDYFVLVDGEEVDFDETTTSTDRTLVISFPAGAEEIEIIGTFVVPEFGAIAALILSIGIISIVILTTKSRVFPRL